MMRLLRPTLIAIFLFGGGGLVTAPLFRQAATPSRSANGTDHYNLEIN